MRKGISVGGKELENTTVSADKVALWCLPSTKITQGSWRLQDCIVSHQTMFWQSKGDSKGVDLWSGGWAPNQKQQRCFAFELWQLRGMWSVWSPCVCWVSGAWWKSPTGLGMLNGFLLLLPSCLFLTVGTEGQQDLLPAGFWMKLAYTFSND